MELTDSAEIQQALAQGHKDLAMLSRQSLINSMYGMPELVIERRS